MASIEFSEFCGENITLSNERSCAKWNITFSGGIVFSEKSLIDGDVLTVDLTGSGHVEIGYSNDDPNGVRDFRQGIKRAKIMNEIRVHKRKCEIRVSMTKNNITFSYNNKTNEAKIAHGSHTWIVLHMKFGNVEAEIGKNFRFHSNVGTNIETLDTSRRKVKLRKQNPACVCVLNRKLFQGEEAEFSISPLMEGNRAPSRYNLVLGYAQLDSKALRDGDPESFSVTEYSDNPARWKIIETFDKEDCDGTLTFGVHHDGSLEYNHSRGKHKNLPLKSADSSSGILIVLDLWRISVTCTGLRECKSYDYATGDASSIVRCTDSAYLEFRNVSPREPLDMPDCLTKNRLSLNSLFDSVDASVKSGEIDNLQVEAWLDTIKQDMEDVYVKPKLKKTHDPENSERVLYTRTGNEYEEPIRGNTGPDGGEYLTPISRDTVANISEASVGISEERYKELRDRVIRIEEGMERSERKNKKAMDKIYELKAMMQNLVVTKGGNHEDELKRDISKTVQRNYSYLRVNLIIFPFCDYLFEGEYLSLVEFERCKELYQKDRYEAQQYILGIFLRRPIKVKILKKACNETKQEFILKKLMEDS